MLTVLVQKLQQLIRDPHHRCWLLQSVLWDSLMGPWYSFISQSLTQGQIFVFIGLVPAVRPKWSINLLTSSAAEGLICSHPESDNLLTQILSELINTTEDYTPLHSCFISKSFTRSYLSTAPKQYVSRQELDVVPSLPASSSKTNAAVLSGLCVLSAVWAGGISSDVSGSLCCNAKHNPDRSWFQTVLNIDLSFSCTVKEFQIYLKTFLQTDHFCFFLVLLINVQ